MKKDLQETRKQGTPMHPLKIHYMQALNGKIDVPYHWQEDVEILWIQKGQLSLMIKENLYMGNHGDIFYINPSELHGMQSMTQDCLYLAFVFPFSWLQFERADEVSEKYLKPLATQSSYVVNYLPHKTAKDAASFFQEIASLYEGNIEGGWLGIKARLLFFYYILYKDGLVHRRKEDSVQMDRLLEISKYMQEHCSESLTLNKLGKEFHMSPKYFSVYFQKHFARNFSDYIMAIRLENAKRLLLETEAGMELVAQQSGFSSSSYFIRIFRETLGMTPGQYRKEFWET